MSTLRTIAGIVSPITADTYMNQIDALFVTIVSIFSIFGLASNSLLLYLIFYKSPTSLKSYRIFLANTTITQICFAILTLCSQPRVLSVGFYTVVIYMGPIQYAGEWFSAMSYLGMIHLALNSFISIMLSMVYRYFSINDRRFSPTTSLVVCVVGYMIPLASYMSCAFIKTSRDPSLNSELIGHLVENLSKYQMVVATNVHNQPTLLIMIFLISVGFLPIYSVIYWCRWKILKKLKMSSEAQSSTTRDNVKRLVRGLTIQSLLPLFSLFPASIFYCLAQTGLVKPSVYSYFIVPCILISCVTDPVITMRCVLPYRRFVRQLCRLRGGGDITASHDRTRSDHYSRVGSNVFSVAYVKTQRVSLK